MTSRADAIAVLKAASKGEHLGRSVTIEQETILAVKRSLSIEEAAEFSADGLKVEGVRVSFDPDLLPFALNVGQSCYVDSIDYTVAQVDRGALTRVIFTRYRA